MIKRISILFFLLFFTPPVFSEEAQGPQNTSQTKNAAVYDSISPYIEKVQAKITKNWHPNKIESPIITVATIKIGKDGDILSFDMLRPTGIKEQDDAAVSAIRKSMPFEPLPESFDGEYIEVHYAFDCEKIGIKDYPKEQPKIAQSTASSGPEVVRFSPAIEKVINKRLNDNEFKLPPQAQQQEEKPLLVRKAKIQEQEAREQSQEQHQEQPQEQTQTAQEQVEPEQQHIQTEEEIEAERARIAELYRKRAVAKQYAVDIQQKIVENWKPVKYMIYSHQDRNNVTAEVIINKNGQLEDAKIVHTTMDKKAENNVLQTIKGVAPYTPFPDEIKRNRIILRIRFGLYMSSVPSYRFE